MYILDFVIQMLDWIDPDQIDWSVSYVNPAALEPDLELFKQEFMKMCI